MRWQEAFDDSAYRPGDEVPGILVAPSTGDWGDLPCAATFADGSGTLEWSRTLVTGSPTDVRLDVLKKK
jgi:hypothetical protein